MRKLNDEEIKEHQLAIMDEIDRFCRKHQIPYFLDGGTLIGAIRHNGYIPWDDDVDIMMLRPDYERFIDLFNAEQSRYHVYSLRTDAGYNLHFAKVADTGTILHEVNLKPNKMEIGINVDLFPVDPLPQDLDDRALLRQLHHLDRIQYCKAHRMRTLHTKPLRQQMLILAYKLGYFWCSKRNLGEKQERLAKQFSQVETPYCAQITCHYKTRLPRWNVTDFVPMDHVFEERQYMIHQGYDHVLREVFGDYMQLPPEEERIPQHGLLAWEVTENE